MSIVVVTGVGPRTGTSFVMKKAKDAGLPIIGEAFNNTVVPKYNPEGYWETTTLDPKQLNNNIVKLWYPNLITFNTNQISRIVVLERKDKLAQMYSIYKVFKDECKLQPIFATLINPIDIFYEHTIHLNEWLNKQNQNKIMRVHTENLTDSISDVLSFLERGLKWE
jgi:hypothetical protein